MAVITVNVSHLCIFSVLMFSVMAHVIELTPLCGTIDGSPPKDSDKIYFKDKSQRIRTVEVNGTVYACYPDGTMIDTTASSSSGENSDERISGAQLQERLRDGNYCDLSIYLLFLCQNSLYSVFLSLFLSWLFLSIPY